MKVEGSYRDRAAHEIREEQPGRTVGPIMQKLVLDSAAMLHRGPIDAKARATAARAYAIANIEPLHAQVRAQFERRGISYHRAETAEDACRIVLGLLGDAKRVAKSKTMVGEEVGLTGALREAGIDVLETDIGEYIVDIEGRGPSHITAPALHLNRARIRALLERTGAGLPDDDPVRLSQFVRDIVGDYFRDCDAGITGANCVIASSGRLGIVENEGNVSLGVSHPRLHISITGIEKVVADEAAALAIFEVLAPSATAQPLTSFMHFVADPLPGQQRHVVFVDNGRSRIAADERYRDVLKCIRCGACMNACPVYRVAGGLSYGAPYMGPIGAVLAPQLWTDGRYADLPFASSLCGRCTEVCPVGIPLHRMLLDLRGDAVANQGKATRRERLAWRGWALAYGGRFRAKATTLAARIGLRTAGAITIKDPDSPDPRGLPSVVVERDPAMLVPVRPAEPPAIVVPLEEIDAEEALGTLFRRRAEALGITVVSETEEREGDIHLRATAGIANTGSVLLTGDACLRRPLLAAKRVVIHLDPTTVVRYPSGLAPHLGDLEALVLTGASRTADIEKIIVRGIHGAEEMVIVEERVPSP